jgi:hypothetical protein
MLSYYYHLFIIIASVSVESNLANVNDEIETTTCSTDFDCSLNGVCLSSGCLCDTPWSGSSCSTLAFAPTTPISGKNIYNNSDPRNTWGGPIIGPDENHKFHAFVPLYSNGSLWHVETCLHGLADIPTGPWNWKAEANFSCGINPQFLAFPNASNTNQTLYSLWERGSLWLSSSLYGPFEKQSGYNVINPAPIYHDGNFYLTSQATLSIETSKNYNGPWTFYANITHPWPDAERPYNVEDPFMWIDKRNNWHIINHAYNKTQNSDCGSSFVSAHWFSGDGGLTWQWSPDEPYSHTVTYDDGSSHTFATLERPYLHFNSQGYPDYLICAVDLDASQQCANHNSVDTIACCDCCKFWDHAGTTVILLAGAEAGAQSEGTE